MRSQKGLASEVVHYHLASAPVKGEHGESLKHRDLNIASLDVSDSFQIRLPGQASCESICRAQHQAADQWRPIS